MEKHTEEIDVLFSRRIKMKDFRQLEVWKRSHELTLKIYKLTKSFPKEELYGVTSQIRRAALSIPTNIAEGCGRKGDVELSRFLVISLGSASELDY
ncbi:four helix bundle protein [Candidatus Latescibacterota bacterium]